MTSKGPAIFTPGEAYGQAPAALYWLHVAIALVTASLLVIAVSDMLIGVFLRYIASKISEIFDLPSIDFFWVEEIGEFALAWMTLLGASLGIGHGTHFKLQVITHRFPASLQLLVARFSGLLVLVFGLVAMIYGWRVALLNSSSSSPGLSINLFWLYFSVVVGGALIAIFGLTAIVYPRLADAHDETHIVE